MRMGGGGGGGDNAAEQEEHLIESMKRGRGNDDVGVKNGTDLAERTRANLLRALRVSESTNESGYATLQQLGRQRETILHAVESVDETRDELRGARGVIRDIRMSVYKEWAVKGIVLVALLLMDILLFYVKFFRRR